MSNKVLYFVVNIYKLMLINILLYFGVLWVKELLLFLKLMKGYFNLNLSRLKVRILWDVLKVLCFLCNLMLVYEIFLCLLIFKLIVFIVFIIVLRV